MDLLNPFDEVFDHTYYQIRKKIENYYGVENADVWYKSFRQHLLDKCKNDNHNIKPFENLYDYCEKMQTIKRYANI